MPTAAKPAKPAGTAQSHTAGANGEETPLTPAELSETIASVEDMLNRKVADLAAEMRGLFGSISNEIREIRKETPEIAREQAREEIQEEVVGLQNKIRHHARKTMRLIVPGSEGDLKRDMVQVSQGAVVGFIGGRRLGPLPFVRW